MQPRKYGSPRTLVAGMALIAGAIMTGVAIENAQAEANAAANTVEDTIMLTVSESCTLLREAGATSQHSATVNPGMISENFSSSDLEVICNAPKTFEVTANFDALTLEEGDETIPYAAYRPTGTESSWTATVDRRNVEQGGSVLVQDTDTNSAKVSVRYSVGVASDQEEGSYKGSARYTLTAEDD